jgi:hypothetical protein
MKASGTSTGREYALFSVFESSAKYSLSFHWQMADESQGHRAIRDQIIRQSRILSQLYASEESRQSRAQTLLATVEQYQTDVLVSKKQWRIVKPFVSFRMLMTRFGRRRVKRRIRHAEERLWRCFLM